MIRRFMILVTMLCCLTGGVNSQSPDSLSPQANVITLSYFNAVEDVIAQSYFSELRLNLADYGLELDIVDYETGSPMAHVLFHPTTSRELEGGNVTYVLNLFRTPMTTLSHGIDTTLFDSAVIFAANPAISAMLSTGVLLFATDHCDHALKIFDDLEAVITTSLWLDHVRFYRGQCAILQEDYPAATAYFESVLYTPTGDYYWASALNLAYVHYLAEDHEQALARLDEISQAIPEWSIEYSEVMTRLAVLYAELDRLDAAFEHIDRAFSVAQLYLPAYYERGILYHVIGDASAAREDLQYYLERVPNGEYTLEAQEALNVLDS
jgi:tetratricopeptide (TPR) repeat protein